LFKEDGVKLDEKSALDPDGMSITGAYDRQLILPGDDEDVVGFPSDLGYKLEHADVHLWYHGSVDLQSSANDGTKAITQEIRNSWYTLAEQGGALTGFYFSRIASTFWPGSDPRPPSGLHNGLVGGTGSRISISPFASGNSYPNVVTTTLQTTTWSVGDTIPLTFYFQDRDSNPTITFWRDTDLNPFNSPAIVQVGQSFSSFASSGIGQSTFNWPLTSGDTGAFFILVRITDGTFTRFDYFGKKFTILPPPPSPTNTPSGPGPTKTNTPGSPPIGLPTVQTVAASGVIATAALINGNIANDDGSSILERRFEWGTTSGALDHASNLDGVPVSVFGDFFWSNLTGLDPNTTYYFRAWARNSAGWANGAELSFTTPGESSGNPTIEITGNGNTIPSGSTNYSIDNNTEFGYFYIGEPDSASYNFRIYNHGTETLLLTGNPVIQFIGSTDFSLATIPSSSVGAGSFTSFRIRFDPTIAGMHEATVIVQSNDPVLTSYTFGVHGEGRLLATSTPTHSFTPAPSDTSPATFTFTPTPTDTETETPTPTDTPLLTPTLSGTPTPEATHPADANGDFQISIGEAAQRLSCWVEGNAACPIGSTAQALSLWLGGGCYEHNSEGYTHVECLSGKNVSQFWNLTLIGSIEKGPVSTATRVLPPCYVAGVTLGVTITLSFPDPITQVVLLEDQLPAGWGVGLVSDNGTFSGGKVRWSFVDGLGNYPPPPSVTYSLMPPASASGTVTFTGTLATPEESVVIGPASFRDDCEEPTTTATAMETLDPTPSETPTSTNTPIETPTPLTETPTYTLSPTPQPTLVNDCSDLSGDGKVNAEDLLILMEDWGKVISATTSNLSLSP
jgi:hypothetical protein